MNLSMLNHPYPYLDNIQGSFVEMFTGWVAFTLLDLYNNGIKALVKRYGAHGYFRISIYEARIG